MALIRYPGSKEKLVDAIFRRFPDPMKYELWSNQLGWEYREPFFGAGAIGFKVLKRLSFECGIWINDIDPGMAALWSSVRDEPRHLIRLIDGFTPSAETFHQFKEEDGRDDLDKSEIGFRKLALHRMSFSGLGVKAGGPIGGKDQMNAKYTVDCRWNPEAIRNEIAVLHRRMKAFPRFHLTCGDFSGLILGAPPECFIYVDPPYYEKGPELYKYPMNYADHARLASMLRDCRASWVLSYDDHPVIRDLYRWALIKEAFITYTTATSRNGRRPKNREVIITPHCSVI